MTKDPHIEVNPNIMMGRPVIKGTRITVQIILEKLAAGESVPSILEAYPHLKEEQIRAVIAYAAARLQGM